jgi:hypothetical protein
MILFWLQNAKNRLVWAKLVQTPEIIIEYSNFTYNVNLKLEKYQDQHISPPPSN